MKYFALSPFKMPISTMHRCHHLFACILLIPVFIFSGVSAGSAADSRRMVISAIVNEQTHAMAKHVLREAYRRIGYSVLFDDLPGQRALEWADKGVTDGDAARIEGTENTYTHLIRVKVPVVHFEGVAFTKTVDRPIRRWEDLKGFRIGVVRGIRYSAIGTEGMEPFFANDMTHLFTILDKGRIEVAVAVLDAGRIEIEKHFKDSGIHVSGSPLFTAPLYHFVHIKHSQLVGPLEAALSDMTASGQMERIWEGALESLLGE